MRSVSSGFVEREALTKTLMEKGDVRRKVGGGRGFLAKKGSEHSWLWAGWGDQGGAPSEQCFREGCHVIFSRRGERRETVEVGREGGKDLIIRMIKPTAMEIGKANYESCYGKCWMLISSGFGGGEQGTSIC